MGRLQNTIKPDKNQWLLASCEKMNTVYNYVQNVGCPDPDSHPSPEGPGLQTKGGRAGVEGDRSTWLSVSLPSHESDTCLRTNTVEKFYVKPLGGGSEPQRGSVRDTVGSATTGLPSSLWLLPPSSSWDAKVNDNSNDFSLSPSVSGR